MPLILIHVMVCLCKAHIWQNTFSGDSVHYLKVPQKTFLTTSLDGSLDAAAYFVADSHLLTPLLLYYPFHVGSAHH